jgi:aminopeptidase N
MDTWTLKMGYPVVTVNRNYVDGSATVTQERFLLRKATTNDSTVYLWWVPITYTSDFRTPKSTWLTNNQSTLKLDNLEVGPNHWVVFNVDEVGTSAFI